MRLLKPHVLEGSSAYMLSGDAQATGLPQKLKMFAKTCQATPGALYQWKQRFLMLLRLQMALLHENPWCSMALLSRLIPRRLW